MSDPLGVPTSGVVAIFGSASEACDDVEARALERFSSLGNDAIKFTDNGSVQLELSRRLDPAREVRLR